MKKVKAFGIAFGMFLIFALILHVIVIKNGLKSNDPGFGTWYSQYKDLSYNAISQNVKKQDMFVFGSSEFRHGLKSPYHPANFFQDSNIHLMTLGGPFSQTLTHSVALGAFAPKMKKRRVVLLVSPTWFRFKSVPPKGYALRFSETEYIAFLKNKDIPKEVKEYVANRSVHLLKNAPSVQKHVKLYNRVLLNKNHVTPLDYAIYHTLYRYSQDKDMLTTKCAMTFLRNDQPIDSTRILSAPFGRYDWSRWCRQARRFSESRSHNPFFMSDRAWKKKYRKAYPKVKAKERNIDLTESKEFVDLEAFLTIAKASNIKVRLIVLPVNGYWYDHTGLNAKSRAAFSKKINRLSGDYGAEIISMSKYDYTPYVNRDTVHPWGEGWVRINEALYNFYKQ